LLDSLFIQRGISSTIRTIDVAQVRRQGNRLLLQTTFV